MSAPVARLLVRSLRVTGVLVGAWLILDIAFTFASVQEGLVSPTAPKLWVTILGVAMVVLRLGVVFVAPPVVTYALVSRAFSWLARRSRSNRSE